jgi:hypothetical protein
MEILGLMLPIKVHPTLGFVFRNSLRMQIGQGSGTVFFFHWLYSPLGPWSLLFRFIIILQRVGLLGRVISTSQGLYLNTGQHKHRTNIYTHQTYMP